MRGTPAAGAAASAQAHAQAEAAESEAEAAEAVREELRRLGCCDGAERAMLAGFFGRSCNFKYYDRRKGGTRVEGLKAARALELVELARLVRVRVRV